MLICICICITICICICITICICISTCIWIYIFSLNPGSALLIVNPLSHTLKTDQEPVLRFLSGKALTPKCKIQISYLSVEKYICAQISVSETVYHKIYEYTNIQAHLLITLHNDSRVNLRFSATIRGKEELCHDNCI